MGGVSAPENLPGKDLLNLDERGEHYAFSQFPRPYAALHRASARTHMGYAVRDSRWRYIEWYDLEGRLVETELYDLQENLLETENLSGHPSVEDAESRLRAVLEGYCKR